MKNTCLTLLLLTPMLAQAQGSLGIFAGHSESLYKETDAKSNALPTVSYEGEHFYLKLPEVGYRFLPKKSPQNLAIGLSYQASNFDPSDSSDVNIRQLDDRDNSTMAFASYQLGRFFSTKLAQDVSGTHDGYFAQIGLSYPVPVSAWQVIPSISYRYMDSKMSNHLFGVSQAESNRTGGAIAAYDSSSVSLITYSIKGIYPLAPNFNAILGVSQTQYDNDILSSPIIEDDTVNSVQAGLLYSF